MSGKKEYTAVIVEDMAPALASLQRDLKDYCPEIRVIGTAGGVVEAAKLLRHSQPDVLFLDIMLGDGTSFDLLEILPELTARLIFVTASDEFAVRAFRFAAVDYLLKPVEGEQLRAAVDRALAQLGPAPHDRLDLLRDTLRDPHTLPDRLSLHTSDNIIVTPIQDIIRCESDDNNTRFVLEGQQTVFVTKTLKHYERLLSAHAFVRVHQSHLVNLRHVVEFRKVDSGYLRLTNGDEVPVASRKRAEVIGLL
ncbi:LytR/AlgR family response regulator transcription factor [Lewinella sp. IMCC34191]|uniref:LytR/AlgR family response regulator transcription factor n=1 Tax=Lewinella sp. IMCC34191 TaxID=2259172 RepID=UPI000E27B7F2|nr:LytTR family DNA-binding domain-containing protein [Lewinella sp. IMCC34191]